MMEKHILPLSGVFCTEVVGSVAFLGAQNAAKGALKSTCFAYFFKFHLPMLCLTAMDCVDGTFGVINNDEGITCNLFSRHPHPSRPYWQHRVLECAQKACLGRVTGPQIAHFKAFLAMHGPKWVKSG